MNYARMYVDLQTGEKLLFREADSCWLTYDGWKKYDTQHKSIQPTNEEPLSILQIIEEVVKAGYPHIIKKII